MAVLEVGDMAKKPVATDEPTPSVAPATLAAVGAMEGDPIVLVKLIGSPSFEPCRSRDGRARQIVVGGRPCEHVGESNGTWQYEQRAW